MMGTDTNEQQKQLLEVDWSTLPQPEDDGAADHLAGSLIPTLNLQGTNGQSHDLSALNGLSIVFAYPMTGRPDRPLPEGWDDIPGARGCTPQACSIRDGYSELLAAGAAHVFGLSTQDKDYQNEAASRLHLPYPLLSDSKLALTNALRLPTMLVEGQILIKRHTIIVENGRIKKTFYPVFPPDRAVDDALAWLKGLGQP